MKGLLTTVFLALICSQTFSQKEYELSHEVLVPAGNLASFNGGTYQQTIGETAVEISLPSFYNLSQGFQQPRYIPPKDFPVREGNGLIFSQILLQRKTTIFFISGCTEFWPGTIKSP